MRTTALFASALMLGLSGLACNDVNDTIASALDGQEVDFDVLQADINGEVRSQETVVFDTDIPDWSEIKDKLTEKTVKKIEYRITNNVGGGGAGLVSVSTLDEPELVTDIADLEVLAGVNVPELTELELYPGAMDVLESFLDEPGMNIYFEGDAEALSFTLLVKLTLEVKIEP